MNSHKHYNGTQQWKTNSPSNFPSLIDKINQKIALGEIFFSIEFFPPQTPEGVVKLLGKIDRLACGGPLFCDITWHPEGDPGGDDETSAISIAGSALNYCGMDTMLHMTCANQTKEVVTRHLEKTKALGIQNILALRGGNSLRCLCMSILYMILKIYYDFKNKQKSLNSLFVSSIFYLKIRQC